MPENDPLSPDAATRRAPVAYDFRRPTKLSREHARLLEMVYETVARQWATVLSSELATPCTVEFIGVEQRSYDDYVSTLPSPNLLAVFHPDPHPGNGFLQISLDTGFRAIEHMLGGQGGEQPDRTPTDIETALLSRVIERMLGELRYGLASVTNLEPVLRGIEFNPQFVQVAAATDLYIVASFTVKLGTFSAPATVAFPAAVLTARSGDEDGPLDSAARLLRHQNRSAMSGLVADVPVEVRVRFVPRQMASAGLLRLQVGDVVRLDHPTDRPLDVVSSGVVCARGVAGTHGPRAACLITSSALPGRASE